MRRVPLSVLLLALICALPAAAQNYLYNVGTQQWGTNLPIENGFINVNNGEIHLEFPLATHAQRGGILNLNEKLVYDSRIWQIVNTGSGYQFLPTNVPNSQGGWRFVTGNDPGSLAINSSTQVYDCYQGAYAFPDGQDTNYFFSYVDPSGARHYFSSVETQQPQPVVNSQGTPCQGQTPPTLSDVPTAHGFAIDGSGYSIVVTNYTSAIVYDANGTQVYPSVVDRNGNYYSTDSNGNLIDSIGRTPVLKTTSGNQTFYDVLTTNGQRARYTVTTKSINVRTNFLEQAVAEYVGPLTVVSSIGLPDGTSYQFTYDANIVGTFPGYGELTSVTLPTGGVIGYTYTNYFDSFQNVNRWLNTRVKDGGTTTYTPKAVSFCASGAGCQEQVTVTSPAQSDTVYTFSLDSTAISQGRSWVTNIAVYQGSAANGVVLQSSNSSYVYQTYTAPAPAGMYPYRAATPTSTTQTHTLNDVGLTSKTVTTLDFPWLNPTQVQFWDFYSGSAPSSPTQTTTYNYAHFYNFEVPGQVTVADGSGNTVSQTGYSYNETSGPGHAAAVPVSNLPQQPTSPTSPANVTTISQRIDSSGATLNAMASYDSAGMTRSITDSNGATSYAMDGTGAFISQTTPPTPSSGVVLASTATSDASTGLPLTATDPNGTTQKFANFDSLNRPMEVDRLDSGGNLVGKQTFSYSAYASGTLAVQGTFTNTSASANQTSYTQFDLYGRVSRAAVFTGQGGTPWYQTDTCYDSSGNVNFRSYPYAGQGWSTTKVCSGAGDTYTYDALNRPILVTHSDGKTIQYKYTGRAVQTTDENLVTRISQVDALGRLTGVCEVSSNNQFPSNTPSNLPSACALDISATGFLTAYSYDMANHITTVTQGLATQGGQTRIFQTDALGRTTRTQEPEFALETASGPAIQPTTYSYAYNSTGLVVTRVRPQANTTVAGQMTTTTTQYDSLGRVVDAHYTDGITPDKQFFYDAPANGWYEAPWQNDLKGRLSLEYRYYPGVGSVGTLYSYDASGNVIANYECEPASCGNASRDQAISYTYDWSGALTSESDGAGVIYSYPRSLAGEVTGITSSFSDSQNPSTIVGSVQNSPFGPTSYTLGNGLAQVLQYDALGRVNQGSICSNGVTNISCSGGSKIYGFQTSWSGGRVHQSNDTVMGQSNTYGYDDLNRLATTNINSGQQLDQYLYDRWGNRWQQNPSGSGASYPSQYSFDTATNHLQQASYDAAGNEITDPQGTQYQYDADGNVIRVINGSNTTYYNYDALNRRIRVQRPGVAYEFTFDQNDRRVSVWNATNYGFSNNVIYWGGAPIGMRSGGTTHFEHSDWLGTPRFISTVSGAVEAAYASSPFGEGFTASGPDYDWDHFAGLDRDSESNTDHAQFRQYHPIQGRWMSPDPYQGSYDSRNPQSLNRYAYVGNNPLSLTDPTGQYEACSTLLLGGEAAAGGGVGAVIAGVTCAAELLGAGRFLESLLGLGGPSFHGTTQQRPVSETPEGTGNPNWDNPLSEHLGLKNGLPLSGGGLGGILGLGQAGCEFGACGAGPTSFQSAAAAAPIPAAVCAVAEPCGAIAVGATVAVVGGIAAYENKEAIKGSWTALADSFLKNYNNLQNENNNRCAVVKQAAIASCSAQFVGRGLSESPVLTRACVRIQMTAQGCFNY